MRRGKETGPKKNTGGRAPSGCRELPGEISLPGYPSRVSREEFPFFIHDRAVHDHARGEHPRPSFERCPPASAVQVVGIDPDCLFFKDGKIGPDPGEKPEGGMPRIAAGLLLVFAITSGRPRVFSRTAASRSGTMVSTPGTPEGESENGCSFSVRCVGCMVGCDHIDPLPSR